MRDVLDDSRGSGLAESLAGFVLILVALAALSSNVVTVMSATTTTATKAERQEYLTALVGDKHAVSEWGSKETPHTQSLTLQNGADVDITTWREDSGSSIRLTAVAPISAGEDAADCSGPADVSKKGCIYASRLHANGLDGITPHAIVRKDMSMAEPDYVGDYVDPRVATDSPFSQGQVIAKGHDDDLTVWRYLVEARAIEENAEIRISQNGKTLAQFPVNTEDGSYFGTFTTVRGSEVVASVTAGDVAVKTVFFYQAGDTE